MVSETWFKIWNQGPTYLPTHLPDLVMELYPPINLFGYYTQFEGFCSLNALNLFFLLLVGSVRYRPYFSQIDLLSGR
jgi:hypothetical protein